MVGYTQGVPRVYLRVYHGGIPRVYLRVYHGGILRCERCSLRNEAAPESRLSPVSLLASSRTPAFFPVSLLG